MTCWSLILWARLNGKVLSRDKIKHSAKVRQRMRFTLPSHWEAKEKCSEDALRMGHHPNMRGRVGHKLNAKHGSTLCNVQLAPSDSRNGIGTIKRVP